MLCLEILYAQFYIVIWVLKQKFDSVDFRLFKVTKKVSKSSSRGLTKQKILMQQEALII